MARDALQLAPTKPRALAFQAGARTDLRLLEVDEELLQELLGSGLDIKGGQGEEAVLCSQSRTFAIKAVETTNSVWLVLPAGQGDCDDEGPTCDSQPAEPQCTPPGQLVGLATQLQRNNTAGARAPVVVAALASSHLELVPAAPRLHVLDALLQERPYGHNAGAGKLAGDEGHGMELDEGSSGAAGYTREELLERVQASPAELGSALQERHSLCLGGRYRSVDPEYLGTLLEVLLLTAVEQGWAADHVIPAAAAARALQASGYDPRVTQHCLEVYGSPEAGSGMAEDGGGDSGLWRLREGAVCCHFARKLLAARPQWGEAEFLDAWQGSVPEGMMPSLEMLRGEALVTARQVKRLAVLELPSDPAVRFAALFRERERWEWDDLRPYVEGLQGPGQTVEGLLLKYARASQARPSDPITYSSR